MFFDLVTENEVIREVARKRTKKPEGLFIAHKSFVREEFYRKPEVSGKYLLET